EAFEEWNLASFQAVAAFRKTPLLLENLPEKPFHTLAGLSNLLNKTGCALNVDVGHCHVAGERVLEEFLASGLVRHAHVSDNDGKTDGHLALGHGTLDLGRAKAALDNARVPDVTIESYAGGMQGVLSSKKAWDAL
ncbi:MAG: TIM barrel protein, partial [Candidatus Micrarchaeota archaeon]|nr:TIM barrel protein [Candidatus Micrarchaeota archaeon]